MTDRIKAMTVLLEPDIREDDCQRIIEAIEMIRRVRKVEMHVSDCDHWSAVQTARLDLQEKIWNVLREKY